MARWPLAENAGEGSCDQLAPWSLEIHESESAVFASPPPRTTAPSCRLPHRATKGAPRSRSESIALTGRTTAACLSRAGQGAQLTRLHPSPSMLARWTSLWWDPAYPPMSSTSPSCREVKQAAVAHTCMSGPALGSLVWRSTARRTGRRTTACPHRAVQVGKPGSCVHVSPSSELRQTSLRAPDMPQPPATRMAPLWVARARSLGAGPARVHAHVIP